MDIFIILLLCVLIIAVVGAIFVLKDKGQPEKAGDDKSLLMLQSQIHELTKTLHDRLDNSHQSMQTHFSSTTKIVSDVTEKLTQIENTNKQVLSFSEQLQSLENILKNPKQRGILGEYFLETVLKNVLPPSAFQLQYKFNNGDLVDAAVFVKDKIIPIDSKFSLENYNKIIEENDPKAKEVLEKQFKLDLKNRIDETSKYIRPNEGTMDFAFMFIPSEGIYYDLLVNQVGAIKVNTRDLIEYAFKEKKVIIVSPTSFHAYLQTVLQGLRALQIEEQAAEIRKNVEKLQKHLLAYDEYMKKLGTQMSTTVGTYNTAYKEFNKVNKDVVKITGEDSDIEVLEIEKPKMD
jgi:DNA recombination protein RmuC